MAVRKIFLGTAILLGCIIAWLFLSSKGEETLKPVSEVKVKQSSPQQKSKTEVATLESDANQDKETTSSSEKRIEEVLQKYIVPITFYGKVIDENGNPVTGAKATFSASDISETGNTRYEVSSKSDGWFSLDGIKGGGILVRVEKEGCYSSMGGQYFDYNRESASHVPDPNNPVIFHLHKKPNV